MRPPFFILLETLRNFIQHYLEALFISQDSFYSKLQIFELTSDLSLDRLYIFRFFTYLSTLNDKEKNVTKTCKRCRISIVLIQSLLHS